MANFLGQPYMGPSSVPHAHQDFFKVYFAGAHVRVSFFLFVVLLLGRARQEHEPGLRSLAV